MPERLKCKFCDWSTAKQFKRKDGKFRGVDHAHQRLLDHVEVHHPAEFQRVQEQLSLAEEPT